MEKIVIHYSLLVLLYVNLETLIKAFVYNAVEEERFCHNICFVNETFYYVTVDTRVCS